MMQFTFTEQEPCRTQMYMYEYYRREVHVMT